MDFKTYQTINRLSFFLIHVFYQNLFQNFVVQDQTNILFYTSALLFPCYIPFCVLNVILTYRFINKESSAFMFQFIQYVAVSLSATFESDFLMYYFVYLFVYYLFIAHAFCIWSHLLALTLVSDSFLALTKPVVYKKYSSRKTAIIFSFTLLLFSFFTQIPLVVVRVYLTESFIKYCYLSYSIFLLIITICIIITMTKFLISMKKITSGNDYY